MAELGVAIVGAGMIGAAHANGYRAHALRFRQRGLTLRLSTVCDFREDTAAALASTYGFERTSTDWKAVLSDPSIAIVSICLPNYLHAEVTSAALKAGKHVLCEKPLALSASDARELVHLAEGLDTTAATVFNYRRFPAVAEIRALVRSGEIGRLVHALVQYQSEYAADPDLPHSWRYVRERAGGGALLDVGTHAIDVARFICGDIAEVRGAVATTTIPKRRLPSVATSGHGHVTLSDEVRDVDTDDVTSALLLFENGCQGLFTASRVAIGMGNTLTLVLGGARGTIRYTGERPGEYQIARTGGSNSGLFVTVPNWPASPYASQYLPVPHDGVAVGYAEAFGFMIAEFLEAIATDKPMANGSLREGLRSAEALEAIQKAADTNECVMLGKSTTT